MNFNRVILAGNLTKKPELRRTQSDMAVVNIGLAVNRRWKSKDGQDQNEVCFVGADMFGPRAEALAQHFDKGDPILIEGRLVLDQWTGQDGTQHERLKVRIENWSFVAPRGSGEANGRTQARSPFADPEPSSSAFADDGDIPF